MKYISIDGVPWDKARAETQKHAEGGTQAGIAEDLEMDTVYNKIPELGFLVVDGDKKHLEFSTGAEPAPLTPDPNAPPVDPNAPPVDPNAMPAMPELEKMMAGGGMKLERLK